MTMTALEMTEAIAKGETLVSSGGWHVTEIHITHEWVEMHGPAGVIGTARHGGSWTTVPFSGMRVAS
jgi:hypothetical protein